MQYMSTRQAADALGVKMWRVRELFSTGAVPDPPRHGGYRLIDQRTFVLVHDKLVELGSIQPFPEIDELRDMEPVATFQGATDADDHAD